ncbi:DEAD/DEAH box helicase [Methyloraptor flagellatus]|uniref:DEAD-box ATP-dependent RNA helicase RhpA n=1 Tax=Methyloraptor flagellatus TaxID=3162530 RepID=A0AAU7XCW6_9HYPH
MTFSTLGLSDKVQAAVEAAGYTQPTPIQEKAIPIVLERKDVVGIAQTGTGKTASFVLPMLTRLESGRARARMPRTLILEPTRELAAQVEENFNKYGINHKLSVALLIGGVSFDEQLKKLDRGVDVLIATPGRLLDLFGRGRLLMTGVEILVIDEADRMLDMGFIPDIEKICKMIPTNRQTLMFSATMPPEIQRLADMFLRDPVRVEAGKPSSVTKTVTQRLIAAGREQHEKREVLRDLITDAQDLKNAIIFCNRKRDVQIVYRSLEKHGFSVGALHGDMDQRARMAMLDAFRNNRLTLLVASDVAARGLDIPDVSHVFNFDVPVHAEDYVHRIGRTGRAGRSGTAVTIVTDLDAKALAAVEKLIGEAPEWIGEPAGEAPRGERRSSSSGERERGRRGRSTEREPRREAGERKEPRGERTERPERAERPDRSEQQPRAERQEARSDRQEPRGERRRDDRKPRDRTTPPPARTEHGRAEHGRSEQPRADQPPRERNPHERREDRRHDRRHDHDEPPVVGLGDHVPAFLLRPTRPLRTAS